MPQLKLSKNRTVSNLHALCGLQCFCTKISVKSFFGTNIWHIRFCVMKRWNKIGSNIFEKVTSQMMLGYRF